MDLYTVLSQGGMREKGFAPDEYLHIWETKEGKWGEPIMQHLSLYLFNCEKVIAPQLSWAAAWKRLEIPRTKVSPSSHAHMHMHVHSPWMGTQTERDTDK